MALRALLGCYLVPCVSAARPGLDEDFEHSGRASLDHGELGERRQGAPPGEDGRPPANFSTWHAEARYGSSGTVLGRDDQSAASDAYPLGDHPTDSSLGKLPELLRLPQSHDEPTALELAVHTLSLKTASILLESSEELGGSLLSVRMKLASIADDMPTVVDRWPFGRYKAAEHVKQRMRAAVPHALMPRHASDEMDAVGEDPFNWILLYKARLMNTLANAAWTRSSSKEHAMAVDMEELLLSYDYDEFTRQFSTSVLQNFLFLCTWGFFLSFLFRIRVFGHMDAPVSLSQMIPGSHDPLRMMDDDFDPSSPSTLLPYTSARATAPPVSSFSMQEFVGVCFWCVLGTFTSCGYHLVRIPPLRDEQDEDYDSSDDGDARAVVRAQCQALARTLREGEVAVRTLLLLFLMAWLGWVARRWCEVLCMSLILVLHALPAAVAASSVERHLSGLAAGVRRADEPERTPMDAHKRQRPFDAALLIHALFDVQVGPRWSRTATVKRSTARMNKSRLRRLRKSRPHVDERGGRRVADIVSGRGEDCLEDADLFLKVLASSDDVHITQRSLVLLLTPAVAVILLAMSSVTHLHVAFGWSPLFIYEALAPADLFRAYGSPGTNARSVALMLEKAFLCLASERLIEIAAMITASALVVYQRFRSLRYLYKKFPSPGARCSVAEVSRRIEMFAKAASAATELSTLRWVVLRAPLLSVYGMVLGLLGAVVMFRVLELTLAVFSNAPSMANGRGLRALVCIGISLSGPLAVALLALATVNAEVRLQQVRLCHEAQTALQVVPSVPPVSADDAGATPMDDGGAEHRELLARATAVLSSELLRWPGGRAPGLAEPALLLLFMVTAAACMH